MSTDTNRNTRPVMRAPVTLGDLLGDLLWPKLLRSASLALSAPRVGLALFAVAALLGLNSLGRALFGVKDAPSVLRVVYDRVLEAAAGVRAGIVTFDGKVIGKSLHTLFIDTPLSLANTHWLNALVVLVPGVLVYAIIGGAISRSAACEASQNVRLTWTQALGAAVARWRSLIGATLGAIVLVWVVMGVLWIAGRAMRVPALDLVTSLFFGLLLIAAILAALVIAAYVLGQCMLVPAVMCEGADAFDAVQRTHAYTLARPGRLVAYLTIVVVQGFIAFAVMWGIVGLAMMLVQTGTGLESAKLMSAAGKTPVDAATIATAPSTAALSVVDFFCSVALAVMSAYALSFVFTASTLIYLVMRQLVDGQDFCELWMPGMVDATLARSDAPSPVRPTAPPPSVTPPTSGGAT